MTPSLGFRLAGSVFALATFVGAFLLFQIQPLIAKYILPWFGGGPGVWTACMLFFQLLLLAGYLYAHLLQRMKSARLQVGLHLALLIVALALLPIIPGDQWKPESPDQPLLKILALLSGSVGLPYFALSTTGPLMQAWFAHVKPGASPYRLYALSNIGSLLALLSYPSVVEPSLSRSVQAEVWGWGLGVFVVSVSASMVLVWQVSGHPKQDTSSSAAQIPAGANSSSRYLWFALPFCASVLLLAVTNTMCQDVAVIPLLWVVPLSLYLLSFIICFDSPRWYWRRAYFVAFALTAVALCLTLTYAHVIPLLLQIAVYSIGLFVCCMVCHGELYRLRPEVGRLTGFYLMIALGGAAGGVFVAIIAPVVFNSYAELPLGLWLTSLLGFQLASPAVKTRRVAGGRVPVRLVAAAGVGLLGVVLMLIWQVQSRETLRAERGFYGTLRVQEAFDDTAVVTIRRLVHGSTLHGLQVMPPGDSRIPVGYYSKGSGVELALSRFSRSKQRRIGVVGLGVGTLAAYADSSDIVRYYEINPQVKRLAEEMFTFLRTSKAPVEVVLGDGRTSLEHEPPQAFDILVLDAFSSDAIPTHLLTREAFEQYVRHLQPRGVIAVNITNRHLDLTPVVRAAARAFGMYTATIRGASRLQQNEVLDWMLLTRDVAFLSDPVISNRASGAGDESLVLWTDERSSLWSILRSDF